MPSTDLPGWRLIFTDDFNTPVARGDFPAAVSQTWGAYPSPWRDTSQLGVYSPDIVTIHDSILDIHLHTADGVPKVAAPVPRISGGDGRHQLYGRYAVRFRADPVPGYKTAWLLWPKSGVWPRDGEIDFPEGDLTGTISAFMHRQGASAGNDQVAYRTGARFDSWHTAVIEWTPAGCEFFLDGKSIGRATERIPETAMRWVIQTETALDGGAPAADAEGHVYLDWVAVWAYVD
jgi:beta-glucanase (GH16 family)